MPKSEPDNEPSGNAGTEGTEADFDRPLDIERAYLTRLNGGTGRGSLRDSRGGYVRVQRTAWDALWRLQRAKVLTPQDLLVIVALATRAGFRSDKMGVVLGNHTELADALGVRRQALVTACRKAEDLRLVDELRLEGGQSAGWRFLPDAYFWLAGKEQRPTPPAVAARLDRLDQPPLDPIRYPDPFADEDSDDAGT